MSNFKVGQKVVCIDDKNQGNSSIAIKIGSVIKNEMYEIRGIDDIGGLLLFGIIAGYWHDGLECGFKITRFRPIDHAFGERIAAEITEKVKQEQLIEVL